MRWTCFIVEYHIRRVNANTKKDDSDVTLNVNYGVASSSSWPNSMCYPKMDITKVESVPKITASFQRRAPSTDANTLSSSYLPQGQPLGFQMVDWKFMVRNNIPTIIRWTIGRRNVTHPSIVLVFGGVTLEFQGDRAYLRPWGLSHLQEEPEYECTFHGFVFWMDEI